MSYAILIFLHVSYMGTVLLCSVCALLLTVPFPCLYLSLTGLVYRLYSVAGWRLDPVKNF